MLFILCVSLYSNLERVQLEPVCRVLIRRCFFRSVRFVITSASWLASKTEEFGGTELLFDIRYRIF